jgi:indole-3-glycerol phosphate synthase
MSSTIETPDLLSAIVAATRRIVEVRASRVTLGDMERRAAAVEPSPSRFVNAVAMTGRFNVIAECKRRSPSRGVLKGTYDPVAIATGYESAGAAALSVLTEPAFFDGSLEHLAAIRATTHLPILRKDFIVDRYQVLEARAAGADALLLIVAALSPSELVVLHRATLDAGLNPLVEIHDLAELDIALDAGATVVGVNNRNLRTLAVDWDVSFRAVDRIPNDVIAVAESGLKTGDDLRQLGRAGYDAFLVGESLMTARDPGQALAALLAGGV